MNLRGLLAALGLAAFQAATAAQSPGRPPIADEGALDNDTEVPSNQAAEVLLRAADEAWTKAESRAPDSEAFAPVLESWRRVLVATAPLDAVATDAARGSDLDGTRGRRTEGIGASVVRRIESAGAAQAFEQRFEGAAQAALGSAGAEPESLARIDHEYPFTRAAATAALRRADLALETGDLELARAWVRRAERHASVANDERWKAALARRRVRLEGASSPTVPHLERASALRLVRTIDLAPEDAAGSTPGPHLRSGLAFRDGGGAWIQSGESLFALSADLVPTRFDPPGLMAKLGWYPAFGEASCDWIQEPALTTDGALVLVCGRARETRGNALVCLEPGATPAATKVRWAWTDAGFVGAGAEQGEAGGDPESQRPAAQDALPPGRLEFQPAPRAVGARILVLLRQWNSSEPGAAAARVDEARTSVWLVAFDAHSGRPQWKQLLATGADLRARARDRFLEARGVSHPCAPLGVDDGRVLAATELGVAALVESADGRLVWTLRTARAEREDAEWKPSTGPIPVAGPAPSPGRTPLHDAGPDAGAAWVLAPGDADRLVYRFSAGELGERILLHPPRRVPDMTDLVGADERGLVLVTRSADRTRLASLDSWTGERVEALPLPRGLDTVLACQVTSGEVLCAAGNALFVHDRARGLALEARVDAPGLEQETAAGLHVRGDRVYLVGAARVWVFEPR